MPVSKHLRHIRKHREQGLITHAIIYFYPIDGVHHIPVNFFIDKEWIVSVEIRPHKLEDIHGFS